MVTPHNSTDWASRWVDTLPGLRTTFRGMVDDRITHEGIRHCRCTSVRGAGISMFTESGELLSPWQAVTRLEHFGHSTNHFVGGKNDFVNRLMPYMLPKFHELALDCPPGLATILLMSFGHIEKALGLTFVRMLFLSVIALIMIARVVPCHVQVAAVSPSFVGNVFVPNFARLPFLLGIDTTVLHCHPSAPKIYVHEDSILTGPILDCTSGFDKTDVWIHLQLLRSTCRVESAEDADLIFVPIHFSCSEWIQEQSHWYQELASRLPEFSTRPRNHIFLFPTEEWASPPNEFTSSGPFGQSLVLSPEAHPIHCTEDTLKQTGYHCLHLPSLSHRLIVIPSFIDSFRTEQLRSHNLPLHQRVAIACFIGLGVRQARSDTENFRHLLSVLAPLPGFIIGGEHDPEYESIMGSSVFCLIPKGIGTWTHRLYEALTAGCIPVILSDQMQFPFPELFWHSFSIKWPMAFVDNHTLPSYLRHLVHDRLVLVLKERVDEVSCWFDYHSDKPDCSPLAGITRQLIPFGSLSRNKEASRRKHKGVD